jgi:hypothetical protein
MISLASKGIFSNMFYVPLRLKIAKNCVLQPKPTREPTLDTEEAIREVGVGEAVTSYAAGKGVLEIVERTLIRPLSSQLGPITKGERADIMAVSPMAGKYDEKLDRKSAF